MITLIKLVKYFLNFHYNPLKFIKLNFKINNHLGKMLLIIKQLINTLIFIKIGRKSIIIIIIRPILCNILIAFSLIIRS